MRFGDNFEREMVIKLYGKPEYFRSWDAGIDVFGVRLAGFLRISRRDPGIFFVNYHVHALLVTTE